MVDFEADKTVDELFGDLLKDAGEGKETGEKSIDPTAALFGDIDNANLFEDELFPDSQDAEYLSEPVEPVRSSELFENLDLDTVITKSITNEPAFAIDKNADIRLFDDEEEQTFVYRDEGKKDPPNINSTIVVDENDINEPIDTEKGIAIVENLNAIEIEEKVMIEPMKPLKTDSLYTITVDLPVLRGTNMMNKHHAYQITTTSTSKNQEFKVFRRYRNFFWLRTVFLKLFPGILIPALPPKKVAGNLDERFVAERRIALEEFLNRVTQKVCLSKYAAFKSFLIENDDKKFEEMVKEQNRNMAVSDVSSLLQRYQKLFPSLFLKANEHAFEFSDLELFLNESEKKMTDLVQAASNLSNVMHKTEDFANKLNMHLEQVYTIESGFDKDAPKRIDVMEGVTGWHMCYKQIAQTYADDVYMLFKHELQDMKSYLEQIKERNELMKRTTKVVQSARKWKGPDVDSTSEGKIEDEKDEENHLALLRCVTNLLLGQELSSYWKHKVIRFRKSMNTFARKMFNINNQLMQVWESISKMESESKTTIGNI